VADEVNKSIKEKIQEKLGKGGKIGAADIADFSSPAEEASASGEEEKVKIEPDSQDPILKTAAKDQPFQVLGGEQLKSEDFTGYNLGMMEMEEVEVSNIDKDEFLDCLVDDRRFTRQFSLYGGRITGKFRSRSTEESMAILAEVNRIRRDKGAAFTLPEYAAFLRHASLAFQVIELNDVVYSLPEGGLRAEYDVETDKIVAPKWTKLVEKYANMEEGLEQGIYTRLMEFERVYWTMVKNAANQDFWNPGGSSIG